MLLERLLNSCSVNVDYDKTERVCIFHKNGTALKIVHCTVRMPASCRAFGG